MGTLDTTGVGRTGSRSNILQINYTTILKAMLIKMSRWLCFMGVLA